MQYDDSEPAISPRHLEGIAKEIHDTTGVECPVDALELADLCGLELRTKGGETARIDLAAGVLRYPVRVRHSRLHGLVAHELGHWALWRALLNHLDEGAARYLAGALMLPRARFVLDLDRTNWDLNELCALHPNVSRQMASVRITQVSPATVTIWDCGKLHAQYGQWDEFNPEDDHAIADEALASEQVVRTDAVSAYPMLDGRHRRVLCVRRAA
jgi:hypothetical protein